MVCIRWYLGFLEGQLGAVLVWTTTDITTVGRFGVSDTMAILGKEDCMSPGEYSGKPKGHGSHVRTLVGGPTT